MPVIAGISLRRRPRRARIERTRSPPAQRRRSTGGGSPTAVLAWIRRNGVALTVLLGLALIGLLALAQSGVAILALARFGASFTQVADTDLPNLIAASRLAELSQSLDARAPELAAAGSQTQRQEIAGRLNTRLAALARTLDRATIDPQQRREVRSQLAGLTTNLKALNGFVRQRIDADKAFESVMARLPALAARVRQVVDQALSAEGSGEPRPGAAISAADRSRLIAWSADSLESVTLMLATPAIGTRSRLERIHAELQILLAHMAGLRRRLPPPLQKKINALHDTIAGFGLGDRSIIKARQGQIDAGMAIETALRFINGAIDRFAATVSAILKGTHQEIRGRSAALDRTISFFDFLIVATAMLSVVAGAAIFAYVRRAVILRLRHVQEYMRAQVDGRPAAMWTGGADEIAEIAQSTQVFVTRIAAARDAAEEARHTTETAYRDLKAAQAKLIHAEKMASLGQLTAGIAHEIKNPLNFVNNFAGLSVELLKELRETAGSILATADDQTRAEIDETVEMLTGNLEKIAQHGKRADGIVKSMLEHSRGSSNDWRSADINLLVEEALNLAYHGARAQNQNFNITLERDFDPVLAPIEVVPQDVTRMLLNLIGNGFYAAGKRKEADPTFRPMLEVATRDLREAVEIRVRDNGTGIPPEYRDRLFQPFFTTKPTGEGTGLGLSISYDIVTQQHGGSITVESEEGAFTEFTVRLPRRWREPTAGRVASAAD